MSYLKVSTSSPSPTPTLLKLGYLKVLLQGWEMSTIKLKINSSSFSSNKAY